MVVVVWYDDDDDDDQHQVAVTMKVINGLYPGVTTVELDNLAAEICATLTTKYPDYATLAARIAVSNLHKETKKQFVGSFSCLFCFVGFGFLFCFVVVC